MLYFEYFLKCKSDNQDDQFSFVFDALHLEFHIFSFLKKGKEIQNDDFQSHQQILELVWMNITYLLNFFEYLL